MSSNRENCFDLLRLLLAIAVLYTHGYLIGGFGDSPFFTFTRSQMILATIAVYGFFGISGMLVTASYHRSSGIWEYLKKRAKRIFPAYWVCLLVTAFVFAPLIQYFAVGAAKQFAWTGDNSSLTYVYRNFLLTINQWGIGESVSSLPYPKSINGSLWSLGPEFKCYLGTIVVCWFGLTVRHKWLLVALYAYLFCIYVLSLANQEASLSFGPMLFALNSHRGVYLAYLTGILLYAYRDYLKFDLKIAAFLACCCLFTLKNGGFLFAAPLLVPLTIAAVGNSFTYRLKHDVSYGVYIYGFVIQQLLITCGIFKSNVYAFLLVSVILSLCFGAFSWVLIERPVLQASRRST